MGSKNTLNVGANVKYSSSGTTKQTTSANVAFSRNTVALTVNAVVDAS